MTWKDYERSLVFRVGYSDMTPPWYDLRYVDKHHSDSVSLFISWQHQCHIHSHVKKLNKIMDLKTSLVPWVHNWCFIFINAGDSMFWKSTIITILYETYLWETLLYNSPRVSCQIASWGQNSSTQGTFWQICSRHALLLNTVNKIPGKNSSVLWTPVRVINWWALHCCRETECCRTRA